MGQLQGVVEDGRQEAEEEGAGDKNTPFQVPSRRLPPASSHLLTAPLARISSVREFTEGYSPATVQSPSTHMRLGDI